MIWDDHQNRCIGELMFKNEVKAVKLRRDRVVVVLKTKVYVYRFSDLKLLDQITTMANPKGLVSLCPDSSHTVLACPGESFLSLSPLSCAYMYVLRSSDALLSFAALLCAVMCLGLARGSIRVELYDINKAMLIKAHDADLAQFSLNVDGRFILHPAFLSPCCSAVLSRIASASEKGTLIRVWDCHTGDPLRFVSPCLCPSPSWRRCAGSFVVEWIVLRSIAFHLTPPPPSSHAPVTREPFTSSLSPMTRTAAAFPTIPALPWEVVAEAAVPWLLLQTKPLSQLARARFDPLSLLPPFLYLGSFALTPLLLCALRSVA
jgi:WD40 repeat protein